MNVQKKDKYLLYFCEGVGSVFDSQVISLLQEITDSDSFQRVILLLGTKNKDEEKYFIEKYKNLQFETFYYRTYPNYSFFNLFNRFSIKKVLSSLSMEYDLAIFHTRGETSAWHLSKVLNNKYNHRVLPDVRGASIEEIDEFYSSNRLLKYFKILNTRNAVKYLSQFNNITVVSNSLKQYLQNNFGIDTGIISVIPCLAGSSFIYNSSSRKKRRNDLGLSDDDNLVVFTSGGIASWQNNEIILKLAENGIKVLNLSKKKISHKNIINKFVDYTEIPDFLNAADAAIIWRNGSVVNKVASPVKFSEYICCGLPVLSNNSVDMITVHISENKCGLIIEDLTELVRDSLVMLKEFDRNKISEAGALKFGLSVITQKYLSLYQLMETI